MRKDFLQFHNWRILGRVYLGYEILKKTASAKYPDHREIWRKARHRLKLVSNYDYFYFMEIYRPLEISENPTKFFSYTVLHPFDPQRVAKARMEEAYMRTRINPALD